MGNNTIAAIILTKDEELHIARCIKSLEGVCCEIFVVDSFSTDSTCKIAREMGATVVMHKWKNYADQFNFALRNCPIHSEWVWRIDADEYLCGNVGQAVRQAAARCAPNVNGIYVRRRIDFMGRPLLHGGWYPSYHLKVFRRGHAECECRWMDEHIRLFDGTAIKVDTGDQVDANLNDLSWWTAKHNAYATREMADMLTAEYDMGNSQNSITPRLFGTEEQRKRWLKMHYAKAPLFVRPMANFALRYILRGGFLDGKEGFIWHFLQGFWYRMLVDAKIYETKKRLGFDRERIRQYLSQNYGAASAAHGADENKER